jgi:ABC-type Fe3+/spermidine/putrescine transport system ATPase subunit
MKIKLQNITKTYGSHKVLEGISFQVDEGELLSILGGSGAGKTTILRIIAGLVTPDSGEVFIDDQNVTQLPPEERNIGYVFQTPLLFPHMTVEENICFGLAVKKWDKDRMEKRCQELLTLLQIDGLEKRMPANISGGQQQRVAIARALAPEPRILLMDEPFSSLDPRLRGEMEELIKKIQASIGVTILFVTHDRNESLAISNSIALLVEGSIIQLDTPHNIYYRPKNKTAALYMGQCNFIPGEVEDNLFKCSIGVFKIETVATKNMELLLRPHQIQIDLKGDAYTVEHHKTVGKEILYLVSDKKNHFLVEAFSNEVLYPGTKIGLVFPSKDHHYVESIL